MSSARLFVCSPGQRSAMFLTKAESSQGICSVKSIPWVICTPENTNASGTDVGCPVFLTGAVSVDDVKIVFVNIWRPFSLELGALIRDGSDLGVELAFIFASDECIRFTGRVELFVGRIGEPFDLLFALCPCKWSKGITELANSVYQE